VVDGGRLGRREEVEWAFVYATYYNKYITFQRVVTLCHECKDMAARSVVFFTSLFSRDIRRVHRISHPYYLRNA